MLFPHSPFVSFSVCCHFSNVKLQLVGCVCECVFFWSTSSPVFDLFCCNKISFTCLVLSSFKLFCRLSSRTKCFADFVAVRVSYYRFFCYFFLTFLHHDIIYRSGVPPTTTFPLSTPFLFCCRRRPRRLWPAVGYNLLLLLLLQKKSWSSATRLVWKNTKKTEREKHRYLT